MKKIGLAISVLLLIMSLVGCSTAQYYEPVDVNSTELTIFTVPGGASTKTIASLLETAGLIQNDWSFVKHVKELSKDGKLAAGDFQLSKSMSQEEIINVLAGGKAFVETFKFAVPEGYEFKMIADKLEKEGLIDRKTFEDLAENHPFEYRFLETDRKYQNRLEGFLFPATYEFKVGADELTILTAMLNKFDAVFTEDMYTRASDLGFTVNQVVTLASIIERETMSKEEFPIVGSVFHNRLKVGQQLESCATVQYLLQDRKAKLLFKDLEVDSPYNTYKYAGLPPAPIASPGELALNSALYPDDTEYYYFVVSGDNDGKHQFSTTYKEHLKAKAIADKKLGN